jgi:endonuclease/exonuclease/phosphatase family metal-dependent hydrolase
MILNLMKNLVLATILLLGTLSIAEAQSDLKIMTYNIRYSTQSDGENWWHLRRDHVVAMLNYERPDVIGMQEALYSQVQFLDQELHNYAWVGVGRNDGQQAGEFSPLFYDTTRVELIEGTPKTLWLSETPFVVSKSWDAAFPRILMYAQFRNKSDGALFWVFNTHFDHVGQTARMNSVGIIQQEITRVVGEDAYFLIGDFNVSEDNPVYSRITRGEPTLIDAMAMDINRHVGPYSTFEGFKVQGGQGRRIDYIFVSPGLVVESHAHLTWFRDGNYLSDHLPVVVKLGSGKP